MDISGISASANLVSATSGAEDAVGNKMLRKALDIQEQNAAQLIESVPDPDSNVGHNINTTA